MIRDSNSLLAETMHVHVGQAKVVGGAEILKVKVNCGMNE